MLSFDQDHNWLRRLNGLSDKTAPKWAKEAPPAKDTMHTPQTLIPKISHSALKKYVTCPKSYQHQYVLMDVERTEGEASIYGKRGHEAIENRIKGGTPMPEEFAHLEPIVARIAAIPGTHYCERGVFLNSDLSVAPDGDSAWLRAYIDFISYNDANKTLTVFDWKFGSSKYIDFDQLKLYCLLGFKAFPEATKARAAYVFCKEKKISETLKMDRSEEDSEWSAWGEKVDKLETAYRFNRWPKQVSGLCNNYCDVKKAGKCDGRR